MTLSEPSERRVSWDAPIGRLLTEDTLRPDESNFGGLIHKITWLQQQLASSDQRRPGRRAVDTRFGYDDEVGRVPFPELPQSFETAAARSLEAFEGCIRWHHPHALFNITPSPLIDTVALTSLTALYNPNALWDITSGKFLLLERRVTAFLAGLVGWSGSPGGLFTFGGKATLMYAVKSGLNRCDPRVSAHGLRGRYVVLTSANAHFSVESVCNYLGLGHASCRRVPVDSSGSIDLSRLDAELQAAMARGDRIACVILSGGATMNLRIDPVADVRDRVERCSTQHGLPYRPHIHVDSVISWAWLTFLADSPELTDPSLPWRVRDKLAATVRAVREFGAADSFAADFHKTGLSPYSSSCYVARDGQALIDLDHGESIQRSPETHFGDICNFDRTFENSRNCAGIISAYQVLHRLGTRGMRWYLLRLLVSVERMRDAIRDCYPDTMQILNEDTLGFEVVVYVDLDGTGADFKSIETGTPETHAHYTDRASSFREWLLHSDYCALEAVPFIGYVASYTDDRHQVGLPAFLLYSTSVNLDDTAIADILRRLDQAIHRFRAEHRDSPGVRVDWTSRPHPPK